MLRSLLFGFVAALFGSSGADVRVCSVDELSLDQLATLLSTWASTRRVNSVWLLEQLDKALTPQLTPPTAQTQMERRLVSPPMPFPPPPLSHFPRLVSQPFIRLPTPPANALVVIKDVTSVEVTLIPRMSVADALREAAIKLSEVETGGRMYELSWRKNKSRRCFVVKTVGGQTVNAKYKWTLTVTHNMNQLWRDVCLPTLNELQLRPGSVVTLEYVSRDQPN